MQRNDTRSWLGSLVLVVNISLGVSFAGLWLLTAMKGQFWRSDFSAYYTAWSIVRDGHGHDLYDLDLQTQYQQAILTEGQFEGGLLPYINPPYATIPFVPLAAFPRSTAFWLWSAGQVVLLVALLRLLWRITASWKRREQWLLISGVIAFLPLFYTLMLGTFSLWMLLCTMSFSWTLKHRQETRTGLWLALGSVKPQQMLMPGFLVLGARRWHALGAGVAFTAIMVAVSLVYPGWQSWPDFLHVLSVISNTFDRMGIVPSVMYNFKGTLALLLGSTHQSLINQASLAALVLAVGATLWLWRGPWQPDDPRFELRMAATILLGVLFSPHLFPHDGLLLVAPAVFFAVYLRERGLPLRPYATFALSCPLLFLVAEFTIGGSLGIRVPVVAMVVLLVWIARMLWWEARTAHPGNSQVTRGK